MYSVNAKRIEAGKYELSYGRGQGKLTATAEKQTDGWWTIRPNYGVKPGSTLREVRTFWALWAKAQYHGEAAKRAAAQTPVESEPANPDQAEHDDDPIESFVPQNDFQRGLLAAARFTARREAITMPRGMIARRILKLTPDPESIDAANARSLQALRAVKRAASNAGLCLTPAGREAVELAGAGAES